MTPTSAPEDKIALYDRLIATDPSIQRKGAANPYTSLNGNMFTILSATTGTLAIRLPPAERQAFMQKYRTGLHEAYGKVQKEYVAVPDDLLERTDELAPYLQISRDYAKTPRPKPTRRKAT